jgi:hypothetical protein
MSNENNSSAPLKTAEVTYPDLPAGTYASAYSSEANVFSAEEMRAYAAQAVEAQAPAAVAVPPSAYVNAAGITASDKPGTVVRKLDAAFHDAVTFKDATPELPATEDSSAGDLVEVQVADAMSREERMIVLQRNADGTPTVWCDPEIADIVRALNSGGVKTLASCSGHGEKPGGIALADGRQLLLLESLEAFNSAMSALTQAEAQAEPVAVSELLDEELRKLWRKAGGEFHGPCVETGTMPEAQLLPFLRSLAAPQAQPADALDADGEAFRTAAKLGLTLRFYGGCAQSIKPRTPSAYAVVAGPDPAASMREAVQRVKTTIDAAMAAAQEGGNASAGKDGAA